MDKQVIFMCSFSYQAEGTKIKAKSWIENKACEWGLEAFSFQPSVIRLKKDS